MFRPEELARRLREIRTEMGLSQVDMAKKLGVSRGALCYYENGQRTPDIAFLCALHELSGCSMEYLTGMSEAKEGGNIELSKETGLNDEALRFMRNNAPYVNALVAAAPTNFSEVITSAAIYALGGAYPNLLYREDEKSIQREWEYSLYIISRLEDEWETTTQELLEQCKIAGYTALTDKQRSFIRATLPVQMRWAEKSTPLIHYLDGERVPDENSLEYHKKIALRELQRIDAVYLKENGGK